MTLQIYKEDEKSRISQRSGGAVRVWDGRVGERELEDIKTCEVGEARLRRVYFWAKRI